MTQPATSPTDLAQRQLDAYNAHDLEAFVACYHPEVEVRDLPDGALRLSGIEAFRARYADVLARPGLRAEVRQRISLGAFVIDEEHVTGVGAQVLRVAAIYEVEGGLIRRVWFVRERTP